MSSIKSLPKKAFCYSHSCTRSYGSFHKGAVEKNVPRGTIDCPECNSVLVWRTERFRRNMKPAETLTYETKYAAALTGQ